MKCTGEQQCDMRQKVLLAPACLTQEACGISDAVMADFMMWEMSAGGHPVITFRFCPWCGGPWVPTGKIVEQEP